MSGQAGYRGLLLAALLALLTATHSFVLPTTGPLPATPRHCYSKNVRPALHATRLPVPPSDAPQERDLPRQEATAPSRAGGGASSGVSRIRTIVGTDGFLEALAGNSDRPVVIKFYDGFCRACKAVRPKFERLAQQNPGVSFYEVELKQSKTLCKSLGITMLPTIQIYQGARGKVFDLPVGPKRFQAAEDALAEVVLSSELNHASAGAIHIPQPE